MAETEEWAQRVCFRIAEVTVMHSVTTRATGFTATEIGGGRSKDMVECSKADVEPSCPAVLAMLGVWLLGEGACQKGSRAAVTRELLWGILAFKYSGEHD
jgi:hypothetical protein